MTGEVGKEGMTMEQLQTTFIERVTTLMMEQAPSDLPTDLPEGLDPSGLIPSD